MKIEEGGMGVTDIELQLNAFKESWVSRLLDTGLINGVINNYLKRVNLNWIYISSTTKRNVEYFKAINHLSKCYHEKACCFNGCKKQNQSILNISNVTFVQQSL